jgi:hypothetical protein
MNVTSPPVIKVIAENLNKKSSIKKKKEK